MSAENAQVARTEEVSVKVVARDYSPDPLFLTLRDIKNRIQASFHNPLAVTTHSTEGEIYYLIVEVREKKVLGIIPWKERRILFEVGPSCVNISCTLYDAQLLDIVKEEMRKYAKLSKATKVTIETDYSRLAYH